MNDRFHVTLHDDIDGKETPTMVLTAHVVQVMQTSDGGSWIQTTTGNIYAKEDPGTVERLMFARNIEEI